MKGRTGCIPPGTREGVLLPPEVLAAEHWQHSRELDKVADCLEDISLYVWSYLATEDMTT